MAGHELFTLRSSRRGALTSRAPTSRGAGVTRRTRDRRLPALRGI